MFKKKVIKIQILCSSWLETESQLCTHYLKKKNRGPSSCAFLTKWTDGTKGNLEYQWPLWETFEISNLNFLKTKLDYNRSKFSRTEWNAYFDWYFEASQGYQWSKMASLQNKILRLTGANK